MAWMHAPVTTDMRRCALTAAPQSRACMLRTPHAHSHGVPLAFICLNGVTAMLSVAVRKA